MRLTASGIDPFEPRVSKSLYPEHSSVASMKYLGPPMLVRFIRPTVSMCKMAVDSLALICLRCGWWTRQSLPTIQARHSWRSLFEIFIPFTALDWISALTVSIGQWASRLCHSSRETLIIALSSASLSIESGSRFSSKYVELGFFVPRSTIRKAPLSFRC